MSASAQLKSNIEVTRGDLGEDLTRNNSPKEPAFRASRDKPARDDAQKRADRRASWDNPERNKTRKRKPRIQYRAIRSRRQALRRLPDDELLSGLDMLHGDERVALLDILLYFSELERRRLYVPMGYGSLFEFCVDTYRYSRSTAWRRISAARCIERFPEVAEMFLAGELNLCALSMIAGVLTGENAEEILSWVGGRPIKDIEMLVARYRPAKVVRDRIRPVFVMSPDTGSSRDGGSSPSTGGGDAAAPPSPVSINPGCFNAPSGGDNADASFNIETDLKFGCASAAGNTGSSFNIETEREIGCASVPIAGSDNPGSGNNTPGSSPASEPERVVVTRKYKIEFAVEPEFINKLNKIKALLSPKFPKGIGLENVIDILMDEYLDRHCPEKRMRKREKHSENEKKQCTARGINERNNKPVESDRDTEIGNREALNKTVKKKTVKKQPTDVKKRSYSARTRRIPQSIRDEVFVRDDGRCTFIGKNGKRCEETWNLEVDHIIPYAKGGDNSPENLRLLCATHNRLEAERAYGTDHMKKFYRRE